jgi:hypothetical protein
LILSFDPVFESYDRFGRPGKSGGPPLFALFLKVEGNTRHPKSSGLVAAAGGPQLSDPWASGLAPLLVLGTHQSQLHALQDECLNHAALSRKSDPSPQARLGPFVVSDKAGHWWKLKALSEPLV